MMQRRQDDPKQSSICVLMMMYADLARQKGDAVRPLETACNLQTQDVEPIVVAPMRRAVLIETSFPVYRVYQPGLRLLNQAIWNVLATVIGSWVIVRCRPGLIYCDIVPGSIAPLWVARLWKRPLIVEVNGLSATDVGLYRGGDTWRVRMARWIDRQLYGYCSAVVSAGGWAEAVMREYEVPQDKIRIVPLAVNHQLFSPSDQRSARRDLGLENMPRIAVFVGAVGPWQGLDLLLEAVPRIVDRCPEAGFLIVGDGSERLLLERKAAALGVSERLAFVGEIPYREVPKYIAASDVGLSIFPPGRGHPGRVSALKTLSYLACGRPVVVSDMDELADSIERASAGIVVKAGSVSDLADAVARVLVDDGLRHRLTKRAECLGAELPDWQDTSKQLTGIFSELA